MGKKESSCTIYEQTNTHLVYALIHDYSINCLINRIFKQQIGFSVKLPSELSSDWNDFVNEEWD